MEPQRKHSTALHTCHPCRRTIPYRIYAVFHTCGIIALMYHHVHSIVNANNTLITCLLLLSDIVLAFMWATTTSLRLNPIHRTEYPEKYAAKPEDFPKLDVFICTADPYKEPPMMVVNTALSVMAYEYPSHKISVYVSDDGGSSLTLFALMEAAKFSKHWLPFCKNNNVQDRSPEVYFSSKSHSSSDEAENLKMMYEDMKSRVEHVVESGKVETAFIACDQFSCVFDLWTDKFTRHDHPTIIMVLQHNETEMMPNLIYVSREKSKVSPHHFKAGALNTLLRVSAVMTNSPIILTLDCDMYSNNPTTPLHALCYLSDPKINFDLGFVQFPQKFQGVNKNDIYASELKRPFDINTVGFDGLMGPVHMGTGCFFNRRAFYGPPTTLILPEIETFGPNRIADKPIKAQDILALAHDVAGCNYECNTNWGSKIGFRYGSLVEDYFTGFMLHCEGWRSIFCSPTKAAFYGDSPKCLTDVIGQQIRWSVGLLEVAFSRYNPLTYGIKPLSLLMSLGYCHYAFWPFWCIPLVVYGILPQVALIHGVSVFPKASDPWFWLYIILFLGGYAQDLSDFLLEGGTYRKWWNDQRMWMVRGLSSFFFGFTEFTLKTLNLSTQGYNVTSKSNDDNEQMKRYEQEIFDFGPSSSMFLPITTVAIMNLLAFMRGLYGIFTWGEGPVLELMLASFAVVNCLPIYEAMVLRIDDGKLPKRICFLAGLLSFVLTGSGYFFLKFLGASLFKKPSEESVSGFEDAPPPVKPSFIDGRLGLLSDRAKSENSSGWPGSSISRNSENSAASSASNLPILSPSSSGSLSSEKSTLNPNAKEFKLNPNAKSFKPSPSATRPQSPQSPVFDGSFYYPPVPPMPGLHIRYGTGAAFPGQQHPMMYNNTTQLSPNQTYYSPNSPQYPQPMMVTQQRPILFMPPTPYQPEMPYKGRDSY